MTAYYNEFDPKAAAWLRQLIINGDIADGVVDERSITEVQADDLNGFTQHHFFAGIGVWSYALRNAGWGDDRPVATASLPCQPFSAAGNQKGKADERHLLPHFLELVGQCNFHTIFGEQVETAIKHGWLDDLYAEMENQDYTVGSAIIGAHSVNKPHIRKRIYWVANSASERYKRGEGCNSTESKREPSGSTWDSGQDGMGNTESTGAGNNKQGVRGLQQRFSETGIEWLYCRDQKYRPIKSGIKPLVDGIARGVVHSSDSVITPNASAEARTIRLKGYGNAIVAPVAEEFIRATMDVIDYETGR
jgi:DNA (cytosine-5)-methyltransferase 1